MSTQTIGLFEAQTQLTARGGRFTPDGIVVVGARGASLSASSGASPARSGQRLRSGSRPGARGAEAARATDRAGVAVFD
jgi:hypothetical protein